MLNSDQLINKVKVYNKFLNPERLDKAYNFAVKAHQNQKRASGDPYSVHPIEVANILTDLKLDSATITTGLLHDTIEDTFATYETIKNEFGEEVADLVDGVTKISVFENTAGANSKVENFRKLILATSKDIRVLLVKIADRLHNMRTIKAITKEDKRQRIAQETMEIYAPLADRMGMHLIRDELEDLSFEILNNEARKLIKKRLDEIEELVEKTKQEGAKVLLGGKRPAGFNKGFFYEPTIFDNVKDDFTIMKEEPFGPLVPMLSFKSFDEVIERANNHELGLCSYVCTNSMERAHLASEQLETGSVAVNTGFVAIAEAPFGGIKQSGYGREGGSMAIKDYLNVKYTHLGIKG